MARAGETAELRRLRSLQRAQVIGQGGEGRHGAEREPVAVRIDLSIEVACELVRQVRDRITLTVAILVADLLVPAAEGDRLERDPAHAVGVVDQELKQRPDLLVVERVHHGDHRGDVNAGGVHVLDRLELGVEQVGDVAVRVGFVGHAVELEVSRVEARLLRLEGELGLEGEAEAVGGRLDVIVADLFGVAGRLQEVRRDRRLAAGELHRHLAARLERDRVVEDLLDLVEAELVDVADLVGVHEARVAHHVATVGQVDRQNRAPPVADGRAAVPVDQLVAQRTEVAPVVAGLDDPIELGIDRENVLEGPVFVARLAHEDLAVFLEDRGLDLAAVPVRQLREIALAADDRFAGLDHAARAQRVGLTRPAEWRVGALAALEQGARSPLRLTRRAFRQAGVDRLKGVPAGVGQLFYGGG